ncbi:MULTISPECIES: RidA family protein [unclassified Beijerinckia]|uniref:RidA family protein n=1 Tax=unclassified Beijerinckia TaxID=2638183 RepID=UPI000897640B|nr:MULTISPECIES: RidA family protein [unclassified Beijerinckia]MDH7799442.1 enamine deaminase RidA (YjgF/YER057c/UK114 family) [Beijerinckia sp. GAS462]SED50590.1 Enamine deaminase RidA, house cleaning of reactive enamine intermediates, YjgF/YER057c/UK114 family [Beijerinckia sp. 28-YEA-48]
MTRRLISTGSPFESRYGYSRAVVQGDMCFISGTTGYDYATMQIPKNVGVQTRNIFKTICGVLTDAGFGLTDVARIQIFVTSAVDTQAVMEVCGEYLGTVRPAASIYIVSGLLDPAMKVEIEITAKKSQEA